MTSSGGVFEHALVRDTRRPELVVSASQRYNGVPIRSSAYSYDTLNRVFKRIDNNAGSPSAVTNTFGYIVASVVDPIFTARDRRFSVELSPHLLG